MIDKPEGDQEAHGCKDGEDSQPVLFAPPDGEEEADTEDDTADFAGDDVEAAEDEEGTDDGAAQVASGEGDSGPAAAHVGNATFTWIEGDRFYTAAGELACYCMAELVEGDDQHLCTLLDSESNMTQGLAWQCIRLRLTLNGHSM